MFLLVPNEEPDGDLEGPVRRPGDVHDLDLGVGVVVEGNYPGLHPRAQGISVEGPHAERVAGPGVPQIPAGIRVRTVAGRLLAIGLAWRPASSAKAR